MQRSEEFKMLNTHTRLGNQIYGNLLSSFLNVFHNENPFFSFFFIIETKLSLCLTNKSRYPSSFEQCVQNIDLSSHKNLNESFSKYEYLNTDSNLTDVPHINTSTFFMCTNFWHERSSYLFRESL
jgi:hypothetical protein